jgi:AcrR family transcriptional regulator
MTKATATKLSPSQGAASERAALAPQRSNGRETVAAILQAAADVIHDRGYEAATMKEIAERSGTKVGSLYRFFPTKEFVADALIQSYEESSESQWRSIIAKASKITVAQLGDLLLNAYAEARQKHKALLPLMESGVDKAGRRQEFRAQNLQRIAAALAAHAPHLRPAAIKSIAVIMLYNMRTMNALTFEASAPNAPGAVNELRSSVRIYLTERLRSV